MSKVKKLIVGSRNSRMALAQANEFIDAFLIENTDFYRENIEIRPVTTSGDINQKDRLDLIGGKGLFVKEIEQMLLDREIDVAVHSMKDMPTIMTAGLKVTAWLKRGDEREVLISNQDQKFLDLKKNSIIGTSSIRRRSQVLNTRTDLCIKLIRGNVDTRIQKFDSGQYDALILGYGGIKRLDIEDRISQIFSIDEILPPACQAAIGIQTLDEDSDLISLISKTNDRDSSIIGLAERTVLATLQANCNSPVGVLACIKHEKEFSVKVELFSHNGKEKYFTKAQGKVEDSSKLAKEAADIIIDKVGHDYIKKLDILEDDFNYSP
tara:strand:+ start:40 stop:1008 length:969 start_codon:yes stop_codon:yes gene_type:complete